MRIGVKKFSEILAAVVIMAIFFTGCAKDEKTADHNVKMPDGVTVEGGKIKVTYEENPTTGYEWTYSIDNEQVVKFESDAYKADDSSDETAGAGGRHTFVFITDHAGQAVITMTCAQNWEGGETDKTIALKVTVKDGGKVSVE